MTHALSLYMTVVPFTMTLAPFYYDTCFIPFIPSQTLGSFYQNSWSLSPWHIQCPFTMTHSPLPWHLAPLSWHTHGPFYHDVQLVPFTMIHTESLLPWNTLAWSLLPWYTLSPFCHDLAPLPWHLHLVSFTMTNLVILPWHILCSFYHDDDINVVLLRWYTWSLLPLYKFDPFFQDTNLIHFSVTHTWSLTLTEDHNQIHWTRTVHFMFMG